MNQQLARNTPGYEQTWPGPEQQRSTSPSHSLQNPFEDTETRPLSRRTTNHAAQLRGLGARRRTRWKNVTRVFPRWFMTVALAGCICAVLISYDNIAVMSRTEKRQFNAIITGLSIALGFSITSSLNAMVGNLRWWILSRRYRSRRKVELILQADSMTHLIKMAYKSHRPSIHIAVLLWVFVIIGSQIAVASLGFCFSTDTAEKDALLESGEILLSDMSSIGTGNIISDGSASLAAQQYAANSYGIISTAYAQGGNFSSIPSAGAIYDPGDPLMFCERAGCRYAFHEKSASSTRSDSLNILTVFTSRTIDATTKCQAWPIVEGGESTGTSIIVATEQGNKTIPIPVAFGLSATMYMVNTTETCGPGCSIISAFESSSTDPWYYNCNVTVSEVANATLPQHEISNNVSEIAAGSIALQGYGVLSFNDTIWQYQVYPAESLYGLAQEGSADSMSFLISRFAIGAIAGIAENNSPVLLPGEEPERGTKLSITHPGLIIMIFLLLIILQLVLEIVVALVANKVVTPDDTPVGLAQVLRAMIEGRTGLEAEYPRNPSAEPLWIYKCPQSAEPGIYDLYMEPNFRIQETEHDVEMEEVRSKMGGLRQRLGSITTGTRG